MPTILRVEPGFMLSGELRPVMFVFVFARMTSSASPTRAGRSMQTVVADQPPRPGV